MTSLTPPVDLRGDIPRDVARAAHQWTSHTPDVRAEQEIAGYVAALDQDWKTLSALADTDDKQKLFEELFGEYREGYRRRYLAMLSAKSRCASTMITGGSGFNTRRNDKANASADKRTNDLIEYRKHKVARIRRMLNPSEYAIMSSDPNAPERLRAKLDAARDMQELMKRTNAAIRKHAKAGHAAQVEALRALGMSQNLAEATLKPDFAGRIGFADYQLKNNGAEIRRLETRLEIIERNKATTATEIKGSNARLEDAPAENRVRLFFPFKPTIDVRDRLKRHGFRWSPKSGAWQAYRNTASLAIAHEVAGTPSPDDARVSDETIRDGLAEIVEKSDFSA